MPTTTTTPASTPASRLADVLRYYETSPASDTEVGDLCHLAEHAAISARAGYLTWQEAEELVTTEVLDVEGH